jgi:hypothetical protein
MADECKDPCSDRSSAGPCNRIGGTQPRNRQHRALEYYFGRDHECLSLFGLVPAVKVFDRNPYRTQLVFAGFISTAANTFYTENLVLSFPVHGPIVGEEWWAGFDGVAGISLAHTKADIEGGHSVLVLGVQGGTAVAGLSAGLNATGYNYSD